MKKNLNPVFNEVLYLKASDSAKSLDITVNDKDLMTSNFLGRATVTLRSLLGKPLNTPTMYVTFL